MIALSDILKYCETRTNALAFKDFPGAYNGLQVSNSGVITKIGATVDAGLVPIEKAVAAKVDFLIVHHGLFWSGVQPFVGPYYDKIRKLMTNNCALYSCHLPLDAHQEIGNNICIVNQLGLKVIQWCVEFEGVPVAVIAEVPKQSREELALRLKKLFPNTYRAIEFGSRAPQRVLICSGGGDVVLDQLKGLDVDTFITGELRQKAFNFAQENKLNLYMCGHYATETFGVAAFGKELAERFKLPFEFIDTGCIL